MTATTTLYPTKNNIERPLSTEEAAHVLHASRSTLRRLRKNGEGPRYIRLGKRPGSAIRYRIADLMKWLDEQTVGGANV